MSDNRSNVCPTHGVVHRPWSKAYKECMNSTQQHSSRRTDKYNGLMSWVKNDTPTTNSLGEVVDNKNGISYEKYPVNPKNHIDTTPEFIKVGSITYVRSDHDGEALDYVLRDGNDTMSIRLQFDDDLTEEEVENAVGIASYCMKITAGGENLPSFTRGGPQLGYQDSSNSIVLAYDMTKSYRSEPIDELEYNFASKIGEMMAEGTPVRRTNRSGPGTEGTRLIDGFGDKYRNPTIYYGGVYDDEELGIE